jgi:hypothetical protein
MAYWQKLCRILHSNHSRSHLHECDESGWNTKHKIKHVFLLFSAFVLIIMFSDLKFNISPLIISQLSHFFCGLFYDAVTDWHCIESNGRMADELERTWKQVVCLIEVVSWHLCGGIQLKHENQGQDSWWPSWDLNQKSPEYKHQVLLPHWLTHMAWSFTLVTVSDFTICVVHERYIYI